MAPFGCSIVASDLSDSSDLSDLSDKDTPPIIGLPQDLREEALFLAYAMKWHTYLLIFVLDDGCHRLWLHNNS